MTVVVHHGPLFMVPSLHFRVFTTYHRWRNKRVKNELWTDLWLGLVVPRGEFFNQDATENE